MAIRRQNPKISMRKGLPGLHRVRAILGMTQLELAKAIGVSEQYVGQLENGHRDCNTILLRKVQRAIGCDFVNLFQSPDDEQSEMLGTPGKK